jgi:DNA-directed RNA polymerase subunit H (RpoH/RPB5)
LKKKKKETPTVDVLSHKLIPEMKVLPAGEKSKMLKKFGISEDQLPKIFSSDPAAVALKAAEGNVIRIERNDGTGKYVAYRVVVEG